ncbi:nitronate monooxygenase [Denitromonas sp.]|uniref:NAD(P)H-dependent flavin oxidoreductase n=1 Tax=Denitromonas sp. TaxID=2734609 RepID=UPI002AFE1E47|nr:nitronate monooxygenase [Denitromonas sp.]
MSALFHTRITELFGIRLPVVASGLQWLSTADYVAAAAHAGLIGFITAASFAELDDLRAEIRRCAELAEGKPWGVNISMLPKLAKGDRVDAVVDLVCAEGVRFVETAGRNPEPYLPRLHAAGIKVLHKVPTVRHARSAQAAGVDAITVVGAECGGHPGTELIGTMVQAAIAARDITVPLIAAGGIATGSQLVAALALGADGAAIGTRFLVAEEIWAHADYKARLVAAQETDTTLVMASLRNTLRALRNQTTDTVQQIEREVGGDLDALMPHIAGRIGRRAYETGNADLGVLSVGQSVAFADRIEPLADIVNRIEAEARAAVARLRSMVAPSPSARASC